MAKKGIKVEEETKDIILDEAPVLETPVEETTEEIIEEVESTEIQENEEKVESAEEEVTEEETEEEITEVIENEETTEEVTEIKLDEAPVEVIDLNNNPVSLKAVGDPVVPKGFVPNINKGEVNTLGCKDGRTYKVISKGVGMYCDNGKTFKI